MTADSSPGPEWPFSAEALEYARRVYVAPEAATGPWRTRTCPECDKTVPGDGVVREADGFVHVAAPDGSVIIGCEDGRIISPAAAGLDPAGWEDWLDHDAVAPGRVEPPGSGTAGAAGIPDAVCIAGDWYCTTPAAAASVRRLLEQNGYEVLDQRNGNEPDPQAPGQPLRPRWSAGVRGVPWSWGRGGVHIYEAWRWAPLEASPVLHRHLLAAVGEKDDKGWYPQGGQRFFTQWQWDQIGLFIRHLTLLDSAEWARQSPGFPKDGPGGIDAVAAFCHPLAETRNLPNEEHLLSALLKEASGRPVTSAEHAAALRALVYGDSRRVSGIISMFRKPGDGPPGRPRQPGPGPQDGPGTAGRLPAASAEAAPLPGPWR